MTYVLEVIATNDIISEEYKVNIEVIVTDPCVDATFDMSNVVVPEPFAYTIGSGDHSFDIDLSQIVTSTDFEHCPSYSHSGISATDATGSDASSIA